VVFDGDDDGNDDDDAGRARSENAVVAISTSTSTASSSSPSLSSSFSSSSSALVVVQQRDEKQQLVQAVTSLLTKLHLPPTLDQQQLMMTHLSLQQQMRVGELQQHELRQKNQQLQSDIENMRSAFVCQICQFNAVNAIFVPCGHLICNTCVDRITQVQTQFDRSQRQKCPFCRAAYDRTVPFFSPLGN
jgi:hypothetical protein